MPKKLKQNKIELPTREVIVAVKTENNQKIDGRKNLPQLFKKGQSGNPNGRPPGTLSFKTELDLAAERELELVNPKTGEKVVKTKNQIIAEKLVDIAASGHLKAIELYAERKEGKPHQSVSGDLNVTSKIVYLPPKEK